MGIGASIFLIAIGAVLTFATHLEISPDTGIDVPGIEFYGISMDAIGVIMMIAGALGLAVALSVGRSRRGSGYPVARERRYPD
ncbi:MAG: hypothetical protein ACRDPK_04270 [Carbonactinosporaceae bacterium]